MRSDFSNSKIYLLITEAEPNKIYIGSTIRRLNQRFAEHLSDYHRCKDVCIHCNRNYSKYSSFDIFSSASENNPVQIKLIEAFSCLNQAELFDREQYYIKYFKENGYSVINKR